MYIYSFIQQKDVSEVCICPRKQLILISCFLREVVYIYKVYLLFPNIISNISKSRRHASATNFALHSILPKNPNKGANRSSSRSNNLFI